MRYYAPFDGTRGSKPSMVARAREIHGARSLVGPAGTRTMAADRPGRRSASSPLRARRAAERAFVGTVRPRGWVHPSIRKAGVFEPPRYGTRLADAGLEIRLKSPMISEMVLWEWEIQEPRKVEE